MNPMLYVYFIAPTREPRTWLAWLRIALRHPGLAYAALVEWCIARATGPITHCCVGDEYATIDYRASGDVLIDTEHYISHAPLHGIWYIAAPRMSLPVDCTPRRMEWVRAIARMLVGPRVKCRDCVVKTREALALAGVSVPLDIHTPGQLWEFANA